MNLSLLLTHLVSDTTAVPLSVPCECNYFRLHLTTLQGIFFILFTSFLFYFCFSHSCHLIFISVTLSRLVCIHRDHQNVWRISLLHPAGTFNYLDFLPSRIFAACGMIQLPPYFIATSQYFPTCPLKICPPPCLSALYFMSFSLLPKMTTLTELLSTVRLGSLVIIPAFPYSSLFSLIPLLLPFLFSMSVKLPSIRWLRLLTIYSSFHPLNGTLSRNSPPLFYSPTVLVNSSPPCKPFTSVQPPYPSAQHLVDQFQHFISAHMLTQLMP